MAYVTTARPREQTVVNFGSLALLVPLLRKLNVADIIDRHLPTDPQAEFSHGKVLSVLLAARVHQPTALVNVAEWAAEHGVEFLCGMPADKLNDDRIGRSLDAFFEQRFSIISEITYEVLRLTKLDLKTPSRIEALVSLLFLALQAYMTLERLYRQSAPTTANPAQRRMTAEKILRKFRVCRLIVERHPYGELVQATRLTSEQQSILTQLSLRRRRKSSE